jgi:hypothetical protein
VAPWQPPAKLFGEELGGPLSQVGRAPAEVGADVHPGRRPERRLLRKWLLDDRVQVGHRRPAQGQRRQERGLVDESSPSDVDQQAAFGELGEQLGIDSALGVQGERGHQHQSARAVAGLSQLLGPEDLGHPFRIRRQGSLRTPTSWQPKRGRGAAPPRC